LGQGGNESYYNFLDFNSLFLLYVKYTQTKTRAFYTQRTQNTSTLFAIQTTD